MDRLIKLQVFCECELQRVTIAAVAAPERAEIAQQCLLCVRFCALRCRPSDCALHVPGFVRISAPAFCSHLRVFCAPRFRCFATIKKKKLIFYLVYLIGCAQCECGKPVKTLEVFNAVCWKQSMVLEIFNGEMKWIDFSFSINKVNN